MQMSRENLQIKDVVALANNQMLRANTLLRGADQHVVDRREITRHSKRRTRFLDFSIGRLFPPFAVAHPL
jgi:hypothetical protein